MYKIFTALKCGEMACYAPELQLKNTGQTKPGISVAQKIIMSIKLTVVILMITILQVSAASFAQEVSLNVKNTHVKQVLNQLTKQTGYNFLCDASIIKATSLVTINANKTALKDVLEQCFANLSVEIIFGDNNTVVIKHKKAVVKPEVVIAITVTGKVSDSKGQTLPGVSVMIKGTQTGAVTDMNGAYSIKVPSSASVLVFSFIGLVTQEIPVGGKTVIDVIMADSPHTLNDVVVVGYGTQSRATLNCCHYQG